MRGGLAPMLVLIGLVILLTYKGTTMMRLGFWIATFGVIGKAVRSPKLGHHEAAPNAEAQARSSASGL
jgi:hypothetical protein